MTRAARMACAAGTGPRPDPGRPLPTVLVVEDDVLVRLAVADHLRGRDLIVIEAASGEEALAVLQSREPVDAVFSDVHLKGATDGFALARWIGANRPALPVVLTSGHAAAADLEHVPAFIGKPYDPGEVECRIRTLLAARADGAEDAGAEDADGEDAV